MLARSEHAVPWRLRRERDLFARSLTYENRESHILLIERRLGLRRSGRRWRVVLGSVCSHCIVAVNNSGAGRGNIPFALQALQLHATPANPSAHTTSVRAKLYKPAVGVRVRARSAPAHPLGDETHVTSHYMRTMSHLTRGGIGHFDPDRFSTSFRGCGPLGSERPVLRTGSITLLRYVSLPVQGRSDRVWARGAEDSDRRVRWATTPPAENMRARALSCPSVAPLSGPGLDV